MCEGNLSLCLASRYARFHDVTENDKSPNAAGICQIIVPFWQGGRLAIADRIKTAGCVGRWTILMTVLALTGKRTCCAPISSAVSRLYSEKLSDGQGDCL